MKKIIVLLLISISSISFTPKKKEPVYWVFCTTTGSACYASSCVMFKIEDWKELTQAWKLRVREVVGDSYVESKYTFSIKDRECSVGNVMYDSKYAATMGRDCYIRKFKEKGADVKIISLDY